MFKEPLLHFLLAGAALFGIYSWLNRADDPNAKPSPQVHISEGDVSSLRETWTLQWQREPTVEELRRAVRQLLNEQLLALEARTMRLDENDTVVRRRLAQKLNFIIEGTTRLVEPTEQTLLAYYSSHPNQFRTEAHVSFTQVYFSSTKRKDPTADARTSLAELSALVENELEGTMGDRFLLGPEFHYERKQMVSRAFGQEFAEAVFGLTPGVWSGPIVSGYGLHLVRVSALDASQLPPFAEVRSQVLEAWRREQEKTANEQYLGRLREKFNVVIDDGVRTLIGGL